MTGELTVAGRTFPFTCPANCQPIAGGAHVFVGSFMSFDLAGARTVVLSARTVDGAVLASAAEIPLGELQSDSQHDSNQVNCWKTGQLL
jgi:hypothetical protein